MANHFYKDVAVPFICLVCAEDKLTAEIKYEAAAAVGEKEALDTTKEAGDESTAVKCPHLVSGRLFKWPNRTGQCNGEKHSEGVCLCMCV